MRIHFKDQLNRLQEKWYNSSPSFEVQTSGSTGVPKRILLSKAHMLASAQATIEYLQLKSGTRALLCLPADKIGGIMMWLRSEIGQWNLEVRTPSSKPLKPGDTFDFVALTPQQASGSLKYIEAVKNLIIGGGPVSPELEEKLKVYSNKIFHTYGMTETISHIALRQIAPQNEQWFRALPNINLRIDRLQRLIINAPNLGIDNMTTNDVVELKDAQTFRWKGRYDHAINSGGIKLHPEVLESKVKLPGRHFFFAGQKDPELGEKLILIIEAEKPLESKELELALQELSRYERPREVYYLPQLQYTSNGKLQRQATLAKVLGE